MTKKTKAGAPNEAAIRDFLAQRLDLVEPGLSLIKTELHLPNRDGAAGFLDIFAQDAKGRLVIIEIKRTRDAAREAVQELYKYAALVRAQRLVQDTDYRLILLSVDWDDLITPFSEFAPNAPFEVRGGKILLGADGLPAGVEAIPPIANPAARKIAVRHFLWGFTGQAAAVRGVKLLAEHMRARGLTDFVFIESRPIATDYEGRVFLYFAQQELRLEEYLPLIQCQGGAVFEEFMENIDGLSEHEDKVAEAADAVWSWPDGAPGRDEIGSDHMEIAHPEKARHWFERIEQTDIRVHRFGRFADPWISDATIVAEVVGGGGESDFRLNYSAQTTSPPQMAGLLQRVENIFFFNPDWLGAVSQLIRYAERKSGGARIELTAFSNEDILRAIAASAFGYPGYVPIFRLDIIHDGKAERFVGLPEWDGTPFDFNKIIHDHFGGDPFTYFMAVHLSEGRKMNRDIMADLGLRYSVFREGPDGGPEAVRVMGASILSEKRTIRGSINTLIAEHQNQVGKLVDLFMTTDQGFTQTIEAFVNSDLPRAERALAEEVNAAPRPLRVMYWSGGLRGCDLCGHPFAPLRFMVDVVLPLGGGANVCAKCYSEVGRGLGLGRGQAYEATDKGWLHVAG